MNYKNIVLVFLGVVFFGSSLYAPAITQAQFQAFETAAAAAAASGNKPSLSIRKLLNKRGYELFEQDRNDEEQAELGEIIRLYRRFNSLIFTKPGVPDLLTLVQEAASQAGPAEEVADPDLQDPMPDAPEDGQLFPGGGPDDGKSPASPMPRDLVEVPASAERSYQPRLHAPLSAQRGEGGASAPRRLDLSDDEDEDLAQLPEQPDPIPADLSPGAPFKPAVLRGGASRPLFSSGGARAGAGDSFGRDATSARGGSSTAAAESGDSDRSAQSPAVPGSARAASLQQPLRDPLAVAIEKYRTEAQAELEHSNGRDMTRSWLRSGNMDARAAQALMADAGTFPLRSDEYHDMLARALYFARMAVEKYIKGLLLTLGIKTSRVHALGTVFEILKAYYSSTEGEASPNYLLFHTAKRDHTRAKQISDDLRYPTAARVGNPRIQECFDNENRYCVSLKALLEANIAAPAVFLVPDEDVLSIRNIPSQPPRSGSLQGGRGGNSPRGGRGSSPFGPGGRSRVRPGSAGSSGSQGGRTGGRGGSLVGGLPRSASAPMFPNQPGRGRGAPTQGFSPSSQGGARGAGTAPSSS